MKLRTYSVDETNSLLELFNERFVLAVELSEYGIELMKQAYNNYVKNFKYSIFRPLHFKPLEFHDYMKYYNLGKIIDITKDFRSHTFSIVGEGHQYIHGCSASGSYFVNETHQQIYNTIKYSSWHILEDKKSIEYIQKVIRFADRPFTLESEDAKMILQFESEVEVLKKRIQQYKDIK